MKTPGSCLCKKVEFEISGEFENFFLCHCQYCQKDTGSAHGANLFSSTAQLRWLTGEENTQTYQLPSTRHSRSFCKTCGSALPHLQMNGKLLVVPAGSLDGEVSIRPQGHLFCSSRAGWDHDLDLVKKYDRLPTGESNS